MSWRTLLVGGSKLLERLPGVAALLHASLAAAFLVCVQGSGSAQSPQVMEPAEFRNQMSSRDTALAPVTISGLAFYRGSLFAATEEGLLQFESGVFTRALTWQTAGSRLSGLQGPWVHAAAGLLFVAAGDGRTLHMLDGDRWHTVEPPKFGVSTRWEEIQPLRGHTVGQSFRIERGARGWDWVPASREWAPVLSLPALGLNEEIWTGQDAKGPVVLVRRFEPHLNKALELVRCSANGEWLTTPLEFLDADASQDPFVALSEPSDWFVAGDAVWVRTSDDVLFRLAVHSDKSVNRARWSGCIAVSVDSAGQVVALFSDEGGSLWRDSKWQRLFDSPLPPGPRGHARVARSGDNVAISTSVVSAQAGRNRTVTGRTALWVGSGTTLTEVDIGLSRPPSARVLPEPMGFGPVTRHALRWSRPVELPVTSAACHPRVVWEARLDEPRSEFRSLLLADGGNVVAFGSSAKTGQASQLLMSVFESSGTLVRTARVAHEYNVTCVAATKLDDGDFVLLGTTADYPFLARIDIHGTTKWKKALTDLKVAHPWVLGGLARHRHGGVILVTRVPVESSDDVDIQAVRVSDSGSVLWRRTVGGPRPDVATRVQQSPIGGYAVVGTTKSFGGASVPFVLHLDEEGNPQRTDLYDADVLAVNWSAPTPKGGWVLVGGNREGGFLVVTNRDSSVQAARTYTNIESVFSVRPKSTGGYVMAGSTSFHFGSGKRDAFILEVDANTEAQWTLAIGGPGHEYGWAVEECPSGGYYMVSGYEVAGGSAAWLLKLSCD